MFIQCGYAASWSYTPSTQDKAACCGCPSCMYSCYKVQRSNWKQVIGVFAYSRLADAGYVTHSRWKSANIVDYFSLNNVRKLCVLEFEFGVTSAALFLLVVDVKEALSHLAAARVRHLLLLFALVPFFKLTAVQHKLKGTWFLVQGVDDEHSNIFFSFRTRQVFWGGFSSDCSFIFFPPLQLFRTEEDGRGNEAAEAKSKQMRGKKIISADYVCRRLFFFLWDAEQVVFIVSSLFTRVLSRGAQITSTPFWRAHTHTLTLRPTSSNLAHSDSLLRRHIGKPLVLIML